MSPGVPGTPCSTCATSNATGCCLPQPAQPPDTGSIPTCMCSPRSPIGNSPSAPVRWKPNGSCAACTRARPRQRSPSSMRHTPDSTRNEPNCALAKEAAELISTEPIDDVQASDWMSVSELAVALGLRPSTLRHWDAEGLVVPDRDTRTGARRYSPAQVRDARVVHQLRKAGYRIAPLRGVMTQLGRTPGSGDIGAALDCPRPGHHSTLPRLARRNRCPHRAPLAPGRAGQCARENTATRKSESSVNGRRSHVDNSRSGVRPLARASARNCENS